MNSQTLTCDFTLSGFSRKVSEENFELPQTIRIHKRAEISSLCCAYVHTRHGSMIHLVIEDEYTARKSDGMTAITLHNSQ